MLRNLFKIQKSNLSFYKVLGIETSCDDTAVAIVSTEREVLAESKYNQFSVHRRVGHSKANSQWSGGIYPNEAKKLHSQNLVRAVNDCIEKMPRGWSDIDAIALTTRPGLEICLWEGINFTKQLLRNYNRKFIPIHHMEAHALTSRLFEVNLKFPFLTLLISGGHCLLVLVEDYDKFVRLGESIDSSPGVYIDKVARELGLFELMRASSDELMSGGEMVERMAAQSSSDLGEYAKILESNRLFCGKFKDCSFSFSGLIASHLRLIEALVRCDANVRLIELNEIQKRVLKNELIQDMCQLVQRLLVNQLSDRIRRALNYLTRYRRMQISGVVISGGVASNLYVRRELDRVIKDEFDLKSFYPPVKYCTDNGVMVAWNGCEKLIGNAKDLVAIEKQDQDFFDNQLRPQARCELGVDMSELLRCMRIKN